MNETHVKLTMQQFFKCLECTADNGVSEPATATIDLKVLCKYTHYFFLSRPRKVSTWQHVMQLDTYVLLFADPPEIEIERSWIHTGVRQEAYLTCIVHAEPAANVLFHSIRHIQCGRWNRYVLVRFVQVLWYREERVIVPSDTRILESSNNKHTLILRNVEESDFGLYSCTADNLLGRSSQNIELSGKQHNVDVE